MVPDRFVLLLEVALRAPFNRNAADYARLWEPPPDQYSAVWVQGKIGAQAVWAHQDHYASYRSGGGNCPFGKFSHLPTSVAGLCFQLGAKSVGLLAGWPYVQPSIRCSRLRYAWGVAPVDTVLFKQPNVG